MNSKISEISKHFDTIEIQVGLKRWWKKVERAAAEEQNILLRIDWDKKTELRGFYFGLVGVQNANAALCLPSAFANTFTYVCIVLTACSAAPKESMNGPQGVDTLYSWQSLCAYASYSVKKEPNNNPDVAISECASEKLDAFLKLR